MDSDAIFTDKVGSYTVKVVPDTEVWECALDLTDDSVRFLTFERRSVLSDPPYNEFKTPEEALEYAKENGYEVYNLYKYEHGRVAYSISPFSCPWDSGQVGFVLIKENIIDPDEFAEFWCKMMTTWVNGDYYGFIVEDETGNQVDSCWGFDDADYCRSEGKGVAEYHQQKELTSTV